MASTADFRNGFTFIENGTLFSIIEFQHVKPGKGGAFVRTKLKNVLTGRVLEKTFRAGEKMEEARIEERKYQYLYHAGDLYHFMEPEAFMYSPESTELRSERRMLFVSTPMILPSFLLLTGVEMASCGVVPFGSNASVTTVLYSPF